MVVLLAFSFFLGGASRQHELRLALVELAALPLLVAAAAACINPAFIARHTLALALIGLLAALPLIQLAPLPPQIWTGLPGRDQAALALQLADITPGWLPLTLTPDRTWRSFLALLPPIAIFLAALTIRREFRLRLIHLTLALTMLAALLGVAQLGAGERLYPWATTSAGSVVGFFANRNHMATLCLMALPFAAVLGARVLRHDGRPGHSMLWLSILFIGLMVVALGIIRSRAGVILLVPTFGASILAAWVASGRGRPKPLLLALLGGGAVAALLVVVFALGPILARFDTSGAPEGRFENWPTVMEAANTYLPLGSGLGSFDAIYRSVEPLERLDATHFNQAHNEYLESWLETGWLGAGLLIVFILWYSRRTWQAWTARPGTDRDLQRAASIAIGVVVLHSAADYPLRTLTIATLFALYCGYLELAARSDNELSAAAPGSTRRTSRSRP
ncbi:O-antigen ligase family protein [Brevundimonas sp.]|uniref:O-antigen ligase family protein n=1 Tax=Brevundimonas sp. TaxID=1871086 RepID=UPI002FC9688B